jgi:hypothetical protein
LIPDVDARAARSAGRKLDRRISNDYIAPNPRIRRRRGDDDAVGVPVGGVFFDQIVITLENPDAEIVVGRCEPVSRRLVPPERVIGSEDSYAAASRCRVAVPHQHIRSKADSGRGHCDADTGQAVGRRGHPFDLAEQGAHNEDSVGAKSLDDARPTNLDIGLSARADAHFVGGRASVASGDRVGLSGHRETIQPQIDVGSAEQDAGRTRHSAGDIADQPATLADRACGGNEAADVFSGRDTHGQE